MTLTSWRRKPTRASRASPEIAVLYGRIAAARRDYKGAIARFTQAAERFSSRSDAIVGMAEALADDGRLDEAEAVLADAMKRFAGAPGGVRLLRVDRHAPAGLG